MLNFRPGDSIEIVNIMYIDKTVMGWQNGDILQIKDVEPEFNRILVYDITKTKAEYVYDYEFAGIRPAKIKQESFA